MILYARYKGKRVSIHLIDLDDFVHAAEDQAVFVYGYERDDSGSVETGPFTVLKGELSGFTFEEPEL